MENGLNDVEAQRRSISKPLPNPPNEPLKPIRVFRVSALLMFALSIASFALTLLIALAGRKPGYLTDEYVLKLNATHVGEDIIHFDRASSTASASNAPSTAPSATPTSASNPLAGLNPFSPSSPLNPASPSNPLTGLIPFSPSSPLNPSNPDSPLNHLGSSLESILGNLIDLIDSGLDNAVNEVIRGIVSSSGLNDFYYLYTRTICQGNTANGTGGNKDGVKIDQCTSYDDPSGGLNTLPPHIQSYLVIGPTNISVPIIAEISRSIGHLSSGLTSIGNALLAFLILSMIGSGVSALLALPSVFFPSSRLLVRANLFFVELAAVASFVVAILLTALTKGVVAAVGGSGNAVGVSVGEGRTVVILAWMSWACRLVVSGYWFAVWYVEIRTWSFVKRRRSELETGNWKGIVGEVLRDLKGEKRV